MSAILLLMEFQPLIPPDDNAPLAAGLGLPPVIPMLQLIQHLLNIYILCFTRH